MTCGSGTYIRSLARDLGEALGCGAHMTALRRYRHGRFELADAVTLAEAEAIGREGLPSLLLPPLEVLGDMPLALVEALARQRLLNGIPPASAEVLFQGAGAVAGDLVRLADADGLLAIARFAPERQHESRGDFELLKVFHPAPAVD